MISRLLSSYVNRARPTLLSHYDVLVVGGGNAGFSAASTAKEEGAENVLLIDKCPEDWAGGNSFFTAGAFRTVHHGLTDLLRLVNNVDRGVTDKIDLEPYTVNDFQHDLSRVTNGRADKDLGSVLIGDSNEAIKWLSRTVGVRFQLSFNRQAYKVGDRYKFWGGMAIKTQDGGKGLMEDHRSAAQRLGVEVLYDTAGRKLVVNEQGGVEGLLVQGEDGGMRTIKAKSVILAAGGFEANPRMRSAYLGPGWDLALVRGTPYNTGDCLEMAMRDVGAQQAGNWSGCHSVAWDANAPPNTGDRLVSNEFTKSGYPIGLMLNVNGERFVDEGIDLRNFTYAKFGKAILAQPNSIAFQVWDSQVTPWLRDEEYRDERIVKIWADSLEELADKCAKVGMEAPDSFVSTIKEYNEAVHAHRKENPGKQWDPAVKDGLSTQSSRCRLRLAKSNWALPIEKGPFMAVRVTCGVTFTFGGLRVNPETAAVIGNGDREVDGLYAVGEMLGGLFYGNYPGGSGLTSGTVFGRRAGKNAAKCALGARGPGLGAQL